MRVCTLLGRSTAAACCVTPPPALLRCVVCLHRFKCGVILTRARLAYASHPGRVSHLACLPPLQRAEALGMTKWSVA